MVEYIEREAALKEVKGLRQLALMSQIDYYNEGVEDAVDKLKALPTADVAPVVSGRWECGKPCPVCGEDRFKGLDAEIWADWEPPYCPNCGARMNEEEDHIETD